MPCPRRIFGEKQAHVFFREGIAPSSGRCGNSARSASDWSEPSPPGRGRRWEFGDPDFGWGRGRRPSGNGNRGPETEDGVGTGDRLIHFPGPGTEAGHGVEPVLAPVPAARTRFPGRAGLTSLARRRYRQHLCGGYWSRSPPIWILCSVPTMLVSFFWKQCFLVFCFFFWYESIHRHPWLLVLTSTQSLLHFLPFARVDIMPFISVPFAPSPLGESSLAVACSHRRVMNFPGSAEPGSVLPKRTSCERWSREHRQSV